MDWSQIIVAIIGLAGTGFGVIKYMADKGAKQNKDFIGALEKQQSGFMQYIEKKNGHLDKAIQRFEDIINGSLNKISDKIDNINK